MPKPIPYPYQRNKQTLWLPWRLGWASPIGLPIRFKMPKHRAWILPNTRRWRKVVRLVLGKEEDRYLGNPPPPWSSYDLCRDPGAGFLSINLDSGAYRHSGPALQNLPIRSELGREIRDKLGAGPQKWDPPAPLAGGIQEAVQQTEFAIGKLMGIWKEAQEDAQSAVDRTAALLPRLRGG